MRHVSQIIWMVAASLVLAGCHRPTGSVSPFEPTVALCDAEKDQLLEDAQDVLRGHQYRLDQVDARSGRITTFPEVSRHLLEFWRRDVATLRDAWEASLNHVRRWTEVRVTEGPAASGRQVEVIVHKERFCLPDRQLNSSASLYHFFSDDLPEARSGRPVRRAGGTWIDLGRDPGMERRLLDAILARSGASGGDAQPPNPPDDSASPSTDSDADG